MEEIIEAWKEIINGNPDQGVYNYENVNVVFSADGVVNIYDCTGENPYGRYKMPRTEEALVTFLEKINEKVGQLIDNNQFICGKCGQTADFPEAVRDKYGNPICEVCSNGGDIRKEKEKTKKKDPLEKIESSPDESSAPQQTLNRAIQLLQNNGYVVHKKVEQYKVVYRDTESNREGISSHFYRSKEEFISNNPKKEFIEFVKSLKKTDSEPL